MGEETPLYRSRYPEHDVRARADEWDHVTRALVEARVRGPPPLAFFSDAEAATLSALFDTLVPQDDRPPDARIPLVGWLDDRLRRRDGDGYRVEGHPSEPEFWKGIAAALDDEARLAFGRAGFVEASREERAGIVTQMRDAAIRAAQEAEAEADFGNLPRVMETDAWTTPTPDAPALRSPRWDALRLQFGFHLILWEAVENYYAHPDAWSEIGYGGPKFPGIYARPLRDNPEEAQEVPRGSP